MIVQIEFDGVLQEIRTNSSPAASIEIISQPSATIILIV
jgi:hypothetical protein